jgi:hypothetical protein
MIVLDATALVELLLRTGHGHTIGARSLKRPEAYALAR